jgi:hypothetical protein
MTHLQGEELEQYLKDWEEQSKRDEAWLKEQGWIEHPAEDPTLHASTWTHLKHGDRVYTWLHSEVLDTAEMDLVYELGWICISQRTLQPEYLGCNGDYSNLQYEEETCRDYEKPNEPEKPLIWGRYVHPVSGKVYTYLEAREIARFYNNSEEEWLKENTPSGWSIAVQALLGDTKLHSDDVLWLKFGPRNAPSDMENVYSFVSLTPKGSES